MAAIGEIIKCTIFYSIPNASVAQNVLWYVLTNAGFSDAEVKTGISDFITDYFGPGWAALGSFTSAMDYGSVDIVNPDGTINRTLGTFDIEIDGNNNNQNSSAAVSAFMMANTGKPKTVGKKYLPGIDEGMIDSGRLSTAGVAALSAMLVLYLGQLLYPSGPYLVPGVLSRTDNTFYQFDASGVISDIPAYQRRRKPNVGS